jgi:GNAT superfamily N-acetyltransferase
VHDAQALLGAYDAQLRLEAEVADATEWHRHGPLVRARWGDSGFVSHRDLADLSSAALEGLVTESLAWFRDETPVTEIEWKTRGHDRPDLPGLLSRHGFVADEEETVMVGRADLLDRPVDLPDGVVVRRAGEGGDLREDVTRAGLLQAEVFGHAPRELEERLTGYAEEPERTGLWIAETVDGQVVSAGRLDVVPGTEFAGLWGGGTHSDWRGRGIYRALVAARARAAIGLGVVYLHSDCTPMSRPILERSGLLPITTTTPYVWSRD